MLCRTAFLGVLCVDFRPVVHPLRALLAAGANGAGSLSDHLAFLAALPCCRHRGRRCLEAGLGHRHLSRTADKCSGTNLTMLR